MVNWDVIGAMAELLGGLGVVASLVFVGWRLRQQANIERAKAQRDLHLQIRDWVSMPSRDESCFNAIRLCLDDFDGADDWSRQQFWGWATNVLLVFESVLYMKADGFIHQGSYIRFEQLVLAICRTRGGGQRWKYMYDVIGAVAAAGRCLLGQLELRALPNHRRPKHLQRAATPNRATT